MPALLEPKLVRTFDTFAVETGVRLRTEFIYLADGVYRPENSFYHNVMYPLENIEGLSKSSINNKGVVRYTVERKPNGNQERIHQEVRKVLIAALAKLSRASRPTTLKKAA